MWETLVIINEYDKIINELEDQLRKFKLDRAEFIAKANGNCCSLFNGIVQKCNGTKINQGHKHACFGCQDCSK